MWKELNELQQCVIFLILLILCLIYGYIINWGFLRRVFVPDRPWGGARDGLLGVGRRHPVAGADVLGVLTPGAFIRNRIHNCVICHVQESDLYVLIEMRIYFACSPFMIVRILGEILKGRTHKFDSGLRAENKYDVCGENESEN